MLVRIVTLVKLLVPVKIFVPASSGTFALKLASSNLPLLSNGTFAERRESLNVPDEILPALRLDTFAPLPLNEVAVTAPAEKLPETSRLTRVSALLSAV